MKILLFVVVCLSFLASPTMAEEKHEHTGAASTELQLNSGKKWETDAPLRSGMTGIKNLIASSLGDIHKGKLTKPQYAELSKKISVHTDSIFKNCKLGPQADAQLHVLLAQILDGNQKMKSEETSKGRQQGAVQIVNALQLYPKYFDHPGWQAIKH